MLSLALWVQYIFEMKLDKVHRISRCSRAALIGKSHPSSSGQVYAIAAPGRIMGHCYTFFPLNCQLL